MINGVYEARMLDNEAVGSGFRQGVGAKVVSCPCVIVALFRRKDCEISESGLNSFLVQVVFQSLKFITTVT